METSKIILEYLKVLLSGPIIAGGVTLLLAWVFRVQLRTLIGRIAHIKLPGGGEFSTSQQEKSEEARESATKPPELLASEAKVNLPQVAGLDAAEAERIQQLVQSERANALLWEYRYLNFYLVRATQVVLDWLSIHPPMSIRQFDSELMNFISDANERKAIFTALQTHHLIQVIRDLIEITPKGKEYLSWRGPLQPLKTDATVLPLKEGG